MKAILIDLVSAENMKASERLAAAVQRRIVEALRLPNRGVKQAPFFVLVGSKIPAILVEVGFVSNPEEAARLTRPEVQKELAGALFQAILYYDSTLGPN
ncbi:MAG: N-acetylmuramoyl-L-alanine amidase [Deltaproteobacteria bacterium]|nr:N-acetylmuramoyl-L-alanine amidase [Deltaproteobacteria bacterium]